MTALSGIDVSAVGQGVFDWVPWHGRIQFAFCKVTEGTGFADPQAASNVARMRSMGIVVGGYHFLHNGDGVHGGAPQARYFLEHAKAAGLKPGDLVAIDAEDGGLDGGTAAHFDLVAAGFANELRKHWGARFSPVLYTEISLAPAFRHMGSCPLWLANPSRVHTGAIGPWEGPSFEQTGQKGVDADVFYGTAAQLAKLAIPHG